jgi:hypothetical protein
VGKLTVNFAGSSRSPQVPKTWKQSAKLGCQFSWLSGSWGAQADHRERQVHGKPISFHSALVWCIGLLELAYKVGQHVNC